MIKPSEKISEQFPHHQIRYAKTPVDLGPRDKFLHLKDHT